MVKRRVWLQPPSLEISEGLNCSIGEIKGGFKVIVLWAFAYKPSPQCGCGQNDVFKDKD